MKKYFLSAIFMIFLSCNNFQKKDKYGLKKEIKEENELKNNSNDLSNLIINLDTEKIWLLSNIYEIDEKVLISIIKDYLEIYLDDKNQAFIEGNYSFLNKKLDSISEKHNVPKKIIASIIYDYEFDNNE